MAPTLGKISSNIEVNNRAREFCALARCIALAGENRSTAREIARENRLGPTITSILGGAPVHTMTRDVILQQRTAVLAGSTTDSTFAAPLADYQNLANSFIESLRSYGAFDAMLGSMKRVPFRTNIGASTVAITGAVVPQGHVKPISNLNLVGNEIDEIKAVAILIITQELARFGSGPAGNLFATELSNAVAVATDTEFIRILIAGATTATSGGTTAEGIRHDLRVMLENITTSSRSQLFLLTTSVIAKALSVLHTNTGDSAFPSLIYRGGDVGGITALVSDGVPSGVMLLADAQQIAAASETIRLDSSSQADVHHDTAPDSPSSASTNMQSLWQSNKVALKAERISASKS